MLVRGAWGAGSAGAVGKEADTAVQGEVPGESTSDTEDGGVGIGQNARR